MMALHCESKAIPRLNMGFIPTKQGDVFIFLVRPNALASGVSIDGSWSCRAGVYKLESGVEEVAPFVVSQKVTHEDGEEYFLVVISPAQTAALAVDKYNLAIEVRNPSTFPVYEKESVVPFILAPQLMPAI